MEDYVLTLDRGAPLVLFGGTFDPPHFGHLIVADDIFYHLAPAAVLFIPAALAPHKTGEEHAPAEARLEMVRRAVGADSRFLVSALELERGGVSYTIDTVDALRGAGFTDVVVATGADNLADIPTWREWERLAAEARLVILSRPGYEVVPPAALAGKFEPLAVTPVPLSSSLVRRRVRAGQPFRYLVPPGVYEYVVNAGLYL